MAFLNYIKTYSQFNKLFKINYCVIHTISILKTLFINLNNDLVDIMINLNSNFS